MILLLYDRHPSRHRFMNNNKTYIAREKRFIYFLRRTHHKRVHYILYAAAQPDYFPSQVSRLTSFDFLFGLRVCLLGVHHAKYIRQSRQSKVVRDPLQMQLFLQLFLS